MKNAILLYLYLGLAVSIVTGCGSGSGGPKDAASDESPASLDGGGLRGGDGGSDGGLDGWAADTQSDDSGQRDAAHDQLPTGDTVGTSAPDTAANADLPKSDGTAATDLPESDAAASTDLSNSDATTSATDLSNSDTAGASVADAAAVDSSQVRADVLSADTPATTSCTAPYHDDGSGKCVPGGTCAIGFHDGGNGTCLANGTCVSGFDVLADGSCSPKQGGPGTPPKEVPDAAMDVPVVNILDGSPDIPAIDAHGNVDALDALPPDTAEPPQNGEPEVVLTADGEVNANVVVIPTELASSVVIENDMLYFPEEAQSFLSALKLGDVLVSGAEPGFIRIVADPVPSILDASLAYSAVASPGASPTGASLLVRRLFGIKTMLGSLVDVLRNVDFSRSYTPHPFIKDASGTILAGDAELGIRAATATLTVSPTVTFRMKITNGKLMETSIAVDTTIAPAETLEAYSDMERTWEPPPLTLFTSPPVPIIFSIGGVPIRSKLQFHAKLHSAVSVATGFRIAAGVSCSTTYSSLVRWTADGGWDGQTRQSPASPCTLVGPTIDANPTTVTLSSGVEVDADWTFLGIGGLELDADGTLSVAASACSVEANQIKDPSWSANFEFAVEASAKFSPFGVQLGSYERELYSHTFPLGEGTYAKGLCQKPSLIVTPNSELAPVALPDTPVGSRSAWTVLTVTNLGDIDTGEILFAITAGPSDFELGVGQDLGTCGLPGTTRLGPKQSCTIKVRFSPHVGPGPIQAALTVADPVNSVNVLLTGVAL